MSELIEIGYGLLYKINHPYNILRTIPDSNWLRSYLNKLFIK